MDWKREAGEKLRQLNTRRLALANMTAELGTAVDKTMNDRVRRKELEDQRDRTAVWVALVEAGLDDLSEEERLVLDRFYIRPVADRVEWLCQELGCEQATVYRRRDRALRHFTAAMYGVGE